MIKPKSRKHEERIKALEAIVVPLSLSDREKTNDFHILHAELMRVWLRLEKLESQRPWYKRMFGL